MVRNRNNRFLTKSRFQNALPGGFEPVTPQSIVQRGTSEPTTAGAEPDSNLCYLCNNLDYAAINFCHNHPLRTPGICIKNLPPLWRFRILAFARGGGGFVGVVPEGRAFSINNFCHFWNFHHYGRNWRLTTLWGLFVALKLYTFLKTMIQP